MPVWQALYDELKDKGFMVVAVAEESRGAEHARPWIEQAKSSYWQLVDVEHRLSDLYNLVNVPQAVWIDEKGVIVRPPETAGSTDHFRRMDLKTRTMSPEDQAERLAVRAAYLDAVRAWVNTGKHALPAEQARLEQRHPARGHHDVVLEPDPAQRGQLVDELPVEPVRVRPRPEWLQEHGDEVEARFHREHLAGFQGPGHPQGRVVGRRLQDGAVGPGELAGHVVDGQAQEMAQAVGHEGAGEALLHGLLRLGSQDARFSQQGRGLEVAELVQLSKRPSRADLGAEFLL